MTASAAVEFAWQLRRPVWRKSDRTRKPRYDHLRGRVSLRQIKKGKRRAL